VAPVRSILFVAIVCLVWELFAAGSADAARPLVSPSEETAPDDGHRFDLVRPGSQSAVPSGPHGNYLASGKLVKYEIRYMSPKAEEVYLLWALDNWQAPDKSLWPPGSIAKKQYPYSKMRKNGCEFVISLSVPEGATLDYCFNVLIASEGVDIWDSNGAAHRDYHSKVAANGAAVVLAQGYSAGRKQVSSGRAASSVPVRIILPSIAVSLIALVGAVVWRTRSKVV